jgi:glycosyltransferase A (GT-A) superfamily protein (DUF2064 family)
VTAPGRRRDPAPGSGTALLVIAKEPVPGRVKTRLVPPGTPRQAATLAEAGLADTLHAVLAAAARRRVLVLDGEPGSWLPPGFDVVPQCGGGLDERLAAVFAAVPGPALLIGMDTPQLTPGLLAVDWEAADAWFVAVARQAPLSRFAARARELAPVLRLAGAAPPADAAREQA